MLAASIASVVAGLGSDPGGEAVVRAIVGFAQALGLETVAEGIETADQLARVIGLGCDHGQGFHFARPLPGDEIAALLARPAPFHLTTARAARRARRAG